jgi:C-terminal processing protease CtpA/Prc
VGASGLRDAVKGHRALTIDLRNDPEGDYSSIVPILQALVPSGTYGEFLNSREGSGTPLIVSDGNPHPPQITLLVDGSTNGPAAIIASALSSHGRATLKGSEMGSNLLSKQTAALPDGSGYTLATGEYRARAHKNGLVAAAEVKAR